MSEASELAIKIRRAVAQDADEIARVYMESAEHHAQLDPDRYWIPAREEIATLYRESDPPSAQRNNGGNGHTAQPIFRAGEESTSQEEAITLVAEVSGGRGAEPARQTASGENFRAGEIVGFLEARLERLPDPMHRDLLYCHIVEIAVSLRRRGQGIGARLLQAAEEWGRRSGAHLASLEYLSANQRAAALYARVGYREVAKKAVKRL